MLAGGGAESRFLTADDGVRLRYLYWPAGSPPPWAVVIFLHGIASHAGWFAETATDLNGHGVEVYGPDRRGSGRSGGPRGHLDRYERALDDVDHVVQLVASEHRGTPLFLAASSWAAKLAVVYAAQRPASLSGLLLLGPGLTAEVKLSPARQLQVVVGHLVAPMAYLPIPLLRSCTRPTRPTWTSSGPIRCGGWRRRPSSSGRQPGWTAGAGRPPPAWAFRSSCSRTRPTR
jgi:alpha-beta hydrolase superfamily lysophospholipase